MSNNDAVNDAIADSFSHPRGLYTLFFTEMWERFSYYGMRALLVLFMTASVANGGMGLDDVTATAIYGLYTAAVYLVSLPGGWMADRLIGAQRSVWYGGIIIMCGHFILAVPAVPTFYIGLVFVVLGTGLLKPNVSAIVGKLYPQGGGACDAGYTIFYIGINVGAMLGPLICSGLGESARFGWHYGFAAAGVGMFIGLLQFRKTSHHLGEAGLHPVHLQSGSGAVPPPWYAWHIVIGSMSGLALLGTLMLSGYLSVDAAILAQYSTWLIAAITLLFFAYVLFVTDLEAREKQRVVVILVLVAASAIFWAGFEQTGSTFNLFAERYTRREFFDFEIPAGWFQSINAVCILTLSPFIAALWVNLAKRNLNPSIPLKFVLGLLQLGLGFLVMMVAATFIADGEQVLPTWLIMTYLLHTLGELCLSPVGLSAMSRLAPKRFASQMMGAWFLSFSLGNLIAGLLAGRFGASDLDKMPGLYLELAMLTAGAGIILLLFLKPVRKMMGELD